MRRYGPLEEGQPEVGEACPACPSTFVVGDYLSLVPIGPGGDAEQRVLARTGRMYTSVTLPVHFACATGVEEPPDEARVPIG